MAGDNLSRENIMNIANHLDMELPLLLPGIKLHTAPDDHRPIKQMNGRSEFTGIDRVRTRDGLVVENYVMYDSATFARLGQVLRAAKLAGQPYQVVHFDGHGAFLDATDLMKRAPRNNPQKGEPGQKANERAAARAGNARAGEAAA